MRRRVLNKISTIRSVLGITEEMDLRSFPYRKQGKTHGSMRCPHCGEGAKGSNKLNVFVGHDGAQRYKCMACGKHGDVIDFVMAVDGCSQKEAIDRLAHKAGWSGKSAPASAPGQNMPAVAPERHATLAPSPDDTGTAPARDEASAALAEAVALIRAHCVDRMTMNYLTGRGLSVATVESAMAAGVIRALPGEPARARDMLMAAP